MSIVVELYKSGTWNNINDYITKASPVPFIERNRDWSPMATPFKCSISISVPYALLLNDPIRVSYNNTIIFAGYVTRSPENYDTREYEVEVTNDLYKLTKYTLNYSTLHNTLTTGTTSQYVPVNGYGGADVYITFLLQTLFSIAGLILDTTSIDNAVAFTYDFGDGNGVINVPYNKLYFDENMLYCINQSVAVAHSVLDSNGSGATNYRSSMITFYDLFIDLCSTLSLGIYITALSNYKIFFETTNYSPIDDIKYSYRSEPLIGIYSDAQVLQQFYNDRSAYRSTTPSTLGQYMGVGEGNPPGSINYYSNMVIYADNRTTPTSLFTPVQLYPTSSSNNINANQAGGYGGLNTTKNKYKALIPNYTEEQITTDIDITPRTVVQNYIDIQNQESIIIQETY